MENITYNSEEEFLKAYNPEDYDYNNDFDITDNN